jgi:putative endonuclease
MTISSHRTGSRGEEIAQSFLKTKGFRVEACNWRSGRLGEIDLIVYDPVLDVLVFVEVKTRKTRFLESPLQAIHSKKVQRMLHLAEAYLAAHPGHAESSVRFDLLSVFFPGNHKPAEILHLENAFSTDG